MGNYFFTTLINGASKLAPYIIFLLAGYFIFIKLPFLFFRKSMDHQKRRLQDENKNVKVIEEKYTVDDYMAFQKKVKEMNKENPKLNQKEEPKKTKTEQKTEQRKEAPKKPAPKQTPGLIPEEVFQFKPNESFTQSELKKRYFELLKQNHPDRVASMGQDFKVLAEKNTKDINKAYEILKKKAS